VKHHKDLLSKEEFDQLRSYIASIKIHDMLYEPDFGRFKYQSYEINQWANRLLPLAQKIFNSQTLKPTYGMFVHYQGKNAKLPKHYDSHACTYTLDLCLYQNEPWDLYVEGVPYTLEISDILSFYGNDQEHWREDLPNPRTNRVGMIWFHYAEPDHWYFTKGPSYFNVILGNQSEEEWSSSLLHEQPSQQNSEKIFINQDS
jgi:hypothetical protein